MLNLAEAWRKKDFQAPGEGKNRLRQLVDETSRYIKSTPALKSALPKAKISDFTVDSHGKGPSFLCLPCAKLFPWRIPVSTAGNAKNSVPYIPNALFMHSFAVELQELYGYQAGQDLSIPNIAPMEIILREKDRKNQASGEGGEFSLSTSPDKLLQE